MSALLKASQRVTTILEAQRQRECLWWPVYLGIGIYCYFTWSQQSLIYGSIVYIGVGAGITWRWGLLSHLLIPIGCAAAALSVYWHSTPLLSTKIPVCYVSGVIVSNESTRYGAKLTLERLRLRLPSSQTDSEPGVLPAVQPHHRLTLTVPRRLLEQPLIPGSRMRGTVTLMPITGALVPGGYNPRQYAYFHDTIGRGYVLGGVQVTPPSTQSTMDQWRHAITQKLLQVITPPYGAVAAALVTGEKAAIPLSVKQQYANSGLAHILAISGLHLTLVMGMVFVVVRSALVLRLGLHYNVKKIAAIIAMVASYGYLMLSGGAIPTQRATIMGGLWLVAILLDREPLTWRGLALAATVLLLLEPYNLFLLSFQLSFGAVAALLWLSENYRDWLLKLRWQGIWQPLGYAATMVANSLAVTLLTAPVIMFNFNRVNLSGIVSNIFAIPLTGFVIMPVLMLWLIATIITGDSFIVQGLSTIVGWALGLLSKIAELGSSVSWANFYCAASSLGVQITLIASLLWWLLWRAPLNYGGGVVMIGVLIWHLMTGQHPNILVYAAPGEAPVVAFYDTAAEQLLLSRQNCRGALKQQWVSLCNGAKIKGLKFDGGGKAIYRVGNWQIRLSRTRAAGTVWRMSQLELSNCTSGRRLSVDLNRTQLVYLGSDNETIAAELNESWITACR